MILLLGGGATVYGIQRQRAAERWAADLTGGDPQRAPALILRNGCAGCHTIPGIGAARGSVGPELSRLADRAFIGGVLPNTAENLVLWIRDSRAVNPRTAMPSTRIPEGEARDIAAYLYSLRDRP
ncbi:c-type cytochrome [Inquilinus limosus]